MPSTMSGLPPVTLVAIRRACIARHHRLSRALRLSCASESGVGSLRSLPASLRRSVIPCKHSPRIYRSPFSTSSRSLDAATNGSRLPTWHPPSDESLDQRPVLVVGAGNIGRRVALIWASNSRPVTIYDISPDALHSATEYITDNLGSFCAERGTHPGQVHTTVDLRTATTTSGNPERNSAGDITATEHTKAPWLAIECLPESLPLKASVLALLERSLPTDCILASNSSTLTTAEMAAEGPLSHPYRLLNTHYFIPPRNRMVELMSSGETTATIFPFLAAQMRRVGFAPVVMPRDIQSRGFIFNRIWAACKRETLAILAEGVAKPADVDALFRDFFHAEKGPCERMDEVGLDIVARVEQHHLERQPELGSDGPLTWLKVNYIQQGKLGEKSGDGLFTAEERIHLKDKHRAGRHGDVEETSGA
ncbi:hypothetical protein C8A03DRAFT_16019 [Achaetomium macrosporum]|uniref:3-hydroxyacyl-CoA dehydrogenase n=1 Tax=Achaetomium macrosporum TaxID=79813 RepID=A0AAN7H6J5_9PEZI|nr:hypothetical protein C8A03DRAFT_16019 [Achaetomium macrosporum]